MIEREKNHDRLDAPASPDRRRVLAGLGLAGGVMVSGLAQAATTADTDAHVTDAPISDHMREAQPFHGLHQAGIVTARPANGMIATFDVLATTKEDLVRLFKTLNERIVFLTTGGLPPQLDPRYPPSDSGILGPVVVPDNLTMTVSLGSSMFDDRFGLKNFKPARLSRMTGSPNDALEPELCHGDISVQICSNTADVNIHALRDLVKNMPDLLYLRWKQEGSVPVMPRKPGAPAESARNFLGFRDGSANPNSSDAALMDEIVWVQPGKDEPAWTHYGSYQAVRIIRNFVERWDRTPLHEQQQIIGRVKATGAPFHGKTEHDVPDYASDPEGKATPVDAHIRLANPRTAQTQKNLILRRPFNYSNGVSKAGQLEMGLLFICYQADLEKGFITVQKRLDGEPLEEYLKPVGGGFFFTLPGVRDKKDYLGRPLLAAAGLA
ncbi:MAG: iron uptake transporter deferrochelatase/peroxidase subunit [Parvibaculaceae bacterium]|nr:iron uptake transporter deferrochelatase/peroxidase subunit [Parvibaculaceae bacterium]